MDDARNCAKCGKAILECMGSVKAGDILEGRPMPRELCDICILAWKWDERGELVAREPEY